MPNPRVDSNSGMTAETTTAELAARAGLPRIVPSRPNSEEYPIGTDAQALTCIRVSPFCVNAAKYPPPSLDRFRTAASREPADAAPVLWYWQMTGKTWDRKTYSYRVCCAGSLNSACLLTCTCGLDPHRTAGEKGALADAAREHRQGDGARIRAE